MCIYVFVPIINNLDVTISLLVRCETIERSIYMVLNLDITITSCLHIYICATQLGIYLFCHCRELILGFDRPKLKFKVGLR